MDSQICAHLIGASYEQWLTHPDAIGQIDW
jgi:hypothetical protein